jgi:hypothetical protein
MEVSGQLHAPAALAPDTPWRGDLKKRESCSRRRKVKLALALFKHRTMKTYVGVDIYIFPHIHNVHIS